MDIKKLDWIDSHKMLALVFALLSVIVFLYKQNISLLQNEVSRADVQSEKNADAMRLYREAYIQWQQLERQTRNLNNDSTKYSH